MKTVENHRFPTVYKNNNKSIEEIYCPDCARKNGLKWHVFVRYNGLPLKYRCKYCGREYYENEDE